MARIRTVKPEFWTSEQVTECSIPARLLFLGLLNFADDGGRMPFSLKRIKMQIFPADDLNSTDIRGMIDELSSNVIGEPLIALYEVNGRQYLQVTGWTKHQRIDRPTYQYPDRNGDIPQGKGFAGNASTKAQHGARRTLDEASTPERKGKEGKGVEGKGKEGGSLTRTLHAHDPPSQIFDWPDDYREQFAEAYPHQVAMAAALKSLDKVRGTVSWGTVLDALATYTTTKPPDREWVNPKRWIEEKRWNDRPGPQPAGNGRHRTDADVARELAGIAERQDRERSQGNPQGAPVETGGVELGGEHARDVSRPR